jgi:hypothetical protein
MHTIRIFGVSNGATLGEFSSCFVPFEGLLSDYASMEFLLL